MVKHALELHNKGIETLIIIVLNKSAMSVGEYKKLEERYSNEKYITCYVWWYEGAKVI